MRIRSCRTRTTTCKTWSTCLQSLSTLPGDDDDDDDHDNGDDDDDENNDNDDDNGYNDEYVDDNDNELKSQAKH